MIFRVFFSLTLFSSLVAADTNNSVELLNNALTQNYSFVERSLSKSDLKIKNLLERYYLMILDSL